MKSQKTIGILSLSDIANDPRVRRQGDALHGAGWNVFGVGLPGRAAVPPAWPVDVVDEGFSESAGAESGRVSWSASVWRNAKTILKKMAWARGAWLAIRGVQRVWDVFRVRVSPDYAETLYWTWPVAAKLYRASSDRTADVWVANDWITLPLAARLARERGGVYVYDTHELALHEYSEQLRWRLLRKPIIHALESRGIRGAKHVSVVSAGIADALQEQYGIQVAPTVIRNMPSYQPATFQSVGAAIKLLYHGIVVPHRGLEEAIESVQNWREEFSLTIRGPGDRSYIEGLREKARLCGVGSRVVFAPAVTMASLVQAAREFDVGFFALPGHSQHNRYALPNKFFEYLMAGLALCVSDLPEMRTLLQRYDLGVSMASTRPEVIAATVNALTPTTIEAYKRNALQAAHELNWDRESQKLLSAYDKVVVDTSQGRV
ncbi:MAG: glycosyltransferase [Nitrospiraceae bacterium]